MFFLLPESSNTAIFISLVKITIHYSPFKIISRWISFQVYLRRLASPSKMSTLTGLPFLSIRFGRKAMRHLDYPTPTYDHPRIFGTQSTCIHQILQYGRVICPPKMKMNHLMPALPSCGSTSTFANADVCFPINSFPFFSFPFSLFCLLIWRLSGLKTVVTCWNSTHSTFVSLWVIFILFPKLYSSSKLYSFF